MTQAPVRSQSLPFSWNALDQPNSLVLAEHLACLQALVPEAAHVSGWRDLQEFALAYVERYGDTVLLLEHAWDFLAAVLHRAWQRGEYEIVARLAAALAYPAGRHENFAEAKHILQLGIAASRRARDQQRFASLLNRLGGLLFVRGRYQQGHRLWYTALSSGESDGPPQGLWEPLASFAQITDVLGNYASAQRFLETFYPSSYEDASDGLAVALFARGLYARFMRHLDRAVLDFSSCLKLLIPRDPGATFSAPRQLFVMVVQAELARAQGFYPRARQYTEMALSLARAFGDRYTFAVLLVDQAMFACRMGWLEETSQLLSLLHEVEHQMEFPNVAVVNRSLEHFLSENGLLLLNSGWPLLPASASSCLPESLSEREMEVLQLVAEGLSNREIAGRLVITTATVKKHLEHIYTRLDVHNRTAAIARARKLALIPQTG